MILEQLSQYRHWCSEQAGTNSLDAIVQREHALLHEADYLVSAVIGMAEFEWDFRCLDEGLMQLVSPFMGQPSGVTALFASALTELDAVSERNRQGVLFVEFGHYATLINDHYTFHPEFSSADVSPRKSSLLTQLRYAGQYLSNYPRYRLVNDDFALSDRQQVDLHDALAGVAVIQGMSRGVLLSWMQRQFVAVMREHYQQNAINLIHSYVAFPVIVALILAGVERERVKVVRQALAHLALAVKLALEQASLQESTATLPPPVQTTAGILAFPGFARAAGEEHLDAAGELYDVTISSSLQQFEEILNRSGVLCDWGAGLATAVQPGRGT